MSTRPNLLMVVPLAWSPLWLPWLKEANLNVFVHGRDDYKPGDIDYTLSFRPPPGFLKTLPNLKTIYSLGAGVDGFLADPEFPKQIPLVRFVDPQLSTEMAQYVVMHVLLQHRQQAAFEAQQKESRWQQRLLPRKTADTRIGILGLGEIGTMAGERLRDLGFPISGWSRSRKQVDGIRSHAGESDFAAFRGPRECRKCPLPRPDD